MKSWALSRLPPRGEDLAVIGLGSNVGDRLTTLQQAVELLDDDERTRVERVSAVYETAPVGGPEQEAFLNAAALVATRRNPRRLLGLCASLEDALGRVRAERWGPRTIDADILLYGGRVVATRRLQIPHPRLAERPFALIPAMDAAPGMSFPDGTTLSAALAACAPVEGVTMIGEQLRAPGSDGRDRRPPMPHEERE